MAYIILRGPAHAVMNGTPPMVVVKNFGHSYTRMIEKHYGHLAPSYISDAIRARTPIRDNCAFEREKVERKEIADL
jgi:hypothetical protein